MMLAANFMDIPPLLALSAAKLAVDVRNKDQAGLRDLFRFDGELIDVEEAIVQQENPWAMEGCLN
jgi:hypothetical protein